MLENNSAFFQRSQQIVVDFLQSVVIIDDRAIMGGDNVHGELQVPPRRSPPHSGSTEAEILVNEETKTPGANDDGYLLDAKKVTDSFARKGIVCSVLCPSEDEREALTETLHKLTTRADIIIIDWSLHGDNGAKALELLQRISEVGTDHPQRLGLIVIYSGDPRFREIPTRICETLGASVQRLDNYTQGFGPIRIAVYAKQGLHVSDAEERSRIVAFEEIADRVIIEFTEMTKGLVPNVLLKSLTQVRQNTYKILRKFSRELDAPFLTHRALLPVPEDAEEYLTFLVAEELKAILEEALVGKEVSLDAIREWVDSEEANFKFNDGSRDYNLTRNDILNLLGNGLAKISVRGLSNSKKGNGHKFSFTRMFSPDMPVSADLDEKFALITTMRSYYENHTPYLNLGTIIKEEQPKKDQLMYFICIQPRCDCVRIKSKRAFPFLPLKSMNSTEKFNMVLLENERYIKMSLNQRFYDVRLIEFPSNGESVIKPRYQEGYYYFRDTKGNDYKWLGELRTEHAYRLAHQFATATSRVGLNESEWLRLWAEKG